MHDHGAAPIELVLALPLLAAGIGYGAAAVSEHRRGRPWPLGRTVVWSVGVLLVGASALGPLAEAAHDDPGIHMVAHVLAGMVAPVLLVLGAPVTLALRTLHVQPARRLSRLLRSPPARVVSHPVGAAAISVGSLALLLRSELFAALSASPVGHWLIVLHLAATGFLFTSAIAGVDPQPHRAGFPLRAVVLVAAVGAHAVLAKSLIAEPSPGLSAPEAERAAVVMYYAGDAAELLLIALFCAQWYHASRPRRWRVVLPDGAGAASPDGARLTG